MNFLKRALKNITRGKTKTALLIITFFLIGNLVIVGLGITSAAENAKTKARMSMNPVVNVTTDYSKWYDYMETLTEEEQQEIYENYRQNFPYITEEMILQLMEDERVRAVNALSVNTFYAEGFEAVPLNNDRENQENGGQSCWTDENGNEECHVYENPSIAVKSNMYDSMIEFESNMFELKEGRFYTQEEINNASPVCLITDQLAEYNNLNVGDTLTVRMGSSDMMERFKDYMDEEDALLSLEIIGIYHTNKVIDENSDDYQWLDKYESPYNWILAPTPAVVDAQIRMSKAQDRYYNAMYGNEGEEIDESQYDRDGWMALSSATIMINDPLDVENFIEDHKESLGEYRKFESDNTTFKQMSRPLDTLSLFANIIVWIVVVNAIVIITLTTALTLKNREYEIGVMLSIGVTKAKIVMQFFVELIIVAVLGFTLAVLSGSMIAGKVGEVVMNYQVATEDQYADEEQGNDYYYPGNELWDTNYFTDITQEDIIEQYKVQISPLIIAEIYVLGLGVVFLSILIPSAMIMRFNPKKILMSTN